MSQPTTDLPPVPEHWDRATASRIVDAYRTYQAEGYPVPGERVSIAEMAAFDARELLIEQGEPVDRLKDGGWVLARCQQIEARFPPPTMSEPLSRPSFASPPDPAPLPAHRRKSV